MLLGPLWRAIVRRSHGGVALSTEHSRGGNALSGSALRDGEQRQRLECCRLACGELTTKGGGQKQEDESKRARRKIRIKEGQKLTNRERTCVCD